MEKRPDENPAQVIESISNAGDKFVNSNGEAKTRQER